MMTYSSPLYSYYFTYLDQSMYFFLLKVKLVLSILFTWLRPVFLADTFSTMEIFYSGSFPIR